MEHETLATELLHEIKASARRWFLAFIAMCLLEVGTIIGLIWYMSLPNEELYSIEQESTQYSTNMVGGSYNGSTTEGNEIQEESK